jgi:hypothetical protein
MVVARSKGVMVSFVRRDCFLVSNGMKRENLNCQNSE